MQIVECRTDKRRNPCRGTLIRDDGQRYEMIPYGTLRGELEAQQ